MPMIKYTKDKILETACEIVRKEGLEALNVRRVAAELGGSVQLIYYNFGTMDGLIEAVVAEIGEICERYMNSQEDAERPYLAKGLGYVGFARDYPEFFRILFMSESKATIDDFVCGTMVTENAVQAISRVFEMEKHEYLEFHKKVWIFTHGIACLVATKTLIMSDEEIKELLATTTQEIYKGKYQHRSPVTYAPKSGRGKR